MDKVKELKLDSTLWATPSKLVNLLDFKPENIRGYFNFSDNLGTLNMLFADIDQQNKYHQVWKEILKIINRGHGELKLHEKNTNIFKIPSITIVIIVIKPLIEKNNKFYLEISLNHCLYEI